MLSLYTYTNIVQMESKHVVHKYGELFRKRKIPFTETRYITLQLARLWEASQVVATLSCSVFVVFKLCSSPQSCINLTQGFGDTLQILQIMIRLHV